VEGQPVAIPTGLDPKEAHLVAQWPAGKPMVCCRFEPRRRFLFAGLESSTFERFDLADGTKVSYAGGHDSWVFSLAFSGDGATTYSGGGDGRVVAWETAAASPRPIRTIGAHRGWIRAMAASPDGALLATGGNDKAVRLWEIPRGSLIRELHGHLGHIYSLEFHPSGKTLLSGDLLGAIREWDVASGTAIGLYDAKPLHTYDAGQHVDFGGVRGLAIAPDAGVVAAGGLHKATNPLGAVHEPIVLVFEAKSRRLARTLLADGITQSVVWRTRFLADGTLMAASGGGSGGFLLFWKAGTTKEYHRLPLPSTVRDMDIHPDGLRVATAHHDGTARITLLAAKLS
jgi:WD40 repeat protein